MVGPLTPSEPTDAQAGEIAAAKGGIGGFLASTLGKVVVGGLVVAVIAAILGAIAFFYFLSRVPDELEVIIPPQTEVVSETSTEAVTPPAQRPSPRLENAFTFRNIFRPTVRPAVPASPTVDGTGTAGVDVPEDTLFLQSVSVVDGVDVATLLWNGSSYTVGEGDVLGDTPWQVLSINGNTVVMLYGDTRVTLVVGQGVGK